MNLTEGKAVLDVPRARVVSKKLPVFYNPVMKLNRDIAVLFVKALEKKIRVADILAGSGVRSIRLKKECKNVKEVFANDADPKAVASIKKHAKKNKVKLNISNDEASKFLLDSGGFDFIEVDPFGSPNPFLDAVTRRIARDGIIAITATDTSALAGSHIKAGIRKYWGRPLRFWAMHEIGIRLLARKVQLIASQYDKALTPVFCHHSSHYVRIYLRCQKGKERVDKILKEHKYVHLCRKCLSLKVSAENRGICCKKSTEVAGPVWTGQLWDKQLTKKMHKQATDEAKELLDIIVKEAQVQTVGFHDFYRYCSLKRKTVPKKEWVFQQIKKKGFKAAPTHFSTQGIRSEISSQAFAKFL